MLTVPELTELRLGKLKEAVGDWETMAGKLQQLTHGTSHGISAADLAQQANSADWSGVNATVTRTFITKTTREFEHAAAETKTILGLLRDIHHDFTQHKSALNAVLDEARTHGIIVLPDGSTTFSAPPAVRDGDGDGKDAAGEALLKSLAERAGRILREATETDRIAATALRAIAKNKHGFDTGGPTDLEKADARQGKEQAAYWAKKIKEGDVGEWTDDELKRFNATLRNQRDNEAFTATLATTLGAEDTLRFWRDLSSPRGAMGDDRAAMLTHVQDNLSMTLANATHVDSGAMDQWKRDVIAAGDQRFPVREGGIGGPYGYQLASSLMTKGKYESDFLQDYGTSLLTFERTRGTADTTVLGEPQHLWGGLPYGGDGTDPVAGFLDGLAHNPEAALEFFDASTSGEGLEKLNNLAYLSGAPDDGKAVDHARAWPTDADGKPLGYDSLGHALESATLGYAYDDPSPSIPALDTPAAIEARESRTALMDRVVDHYGSAEAIDAQPGMRDSLARMAAGHVDSITWSISNFDGSRDVAGVDSLLDASRHHLADFGVADAKQFLRALASDQDSYATVSSAQQIYGASLLAAHGSDHEKALDAAGYGLMVHGMLDEARMEAIGQEFAADEDKRNEALEKQTEWRKFAVGTVVGTAVVAAGGPAGAGLAAVAVPLAYSTAGEAANTWAGNSMDWLNPTPYSNDQESIETIDQAQVASRQNAMVHILNYAHDNGIVDETWRRDHQGHMWDMYSAGAEESDTDNTRIG
ncbi:hypothetical protein [Streptomyces sp. KLOTTS4A1]|uniref:hypothetical protein n=1 Tax=Streptomyces sp. KLOTTS4A1 TaxID=3390996 RepID=UPI0039F44A66